MRTVLDEFQKRRGHLSTIRFGDEKGRLTDFLDWMEKQPEVAQILAVLRTIQVENLFSPHGFRPRANTQEDVCAIGLYLLDKIKAGVGLHAVAIKHGIRPEFGGSRGQDYVDEAMRSYIDPLCDHIEAALESLGDKISVEDAVQTRFDLLTEAEFGKMFPATNTALKRIAEYCAQPEDTGSWFHVATSCREILGTLVRELQGLGAVTPALELKQGDTKGILKQFVKERSSASDTLVDLIQAIWSYVQSTVHRQAASKQDAVRAYLWTGLLISEIWMLVRESKTAIDSVVINH